MAFKKYNDVMKSRETQLYFVIFGIALLVFIMLFGFGIFSFGSNQTNKTAQSLPTAGSSDFDFQTSDIDSVAAPPLSENYTQDEIENIAVYDKLNKGVVNITTEVMGYNWFLEPIPREGSSGSGSIIDTRGYILTNNHVVEKAYKVNVTLADGEAFEGEVIGSDQENDWQLSKLIQATTRLQRFLLGVHQG